MRRILAALIALAGWSNGAVAQMPLIEDLDPSYRAGAAIDKETPAQPAAPRLRAAFGAGVGFAPRFEGSNHERARLAPVVHLAYGPVFFGLGGLGVNLYRDPRWRFGANLAFGGGTRESADDRVQGLGDVDRSVLAGLFAVYQSREVLARAHISTDVGGHGQGTVARLDVFGRLRGGDGLAFFAGPGLTWVDRRHMQTYFGVSAEQAARSGLPAFDAGAGVSSMRLSAGAAYRIDPRWRLIGIYSLGRLQGDAAASPIIVTRTQNSLFVSAIYLLR